MRVKCPASREHHRSVNCYSKAWSPNDQAFVVLGIKSEAVDLAFAGRAKFGQIIKEYRNAGMQYDPGEIVGTQRRGVTGLNFHEERSICTSHVERHNATNRLFMKRLNRLTYCFSKKLDNLAAAVAMHLANYNFCWRCRYPDGSGKAGKRRPPAAMLAGITNRLWSFEDFYNEVCHYG